MKKQKDFRLVNRDNRISILAANGWDECVITPDMIGTVLLFDQASIEEALKWLAEEELLESESTAEQLEALEDCVKIEQTEFGVAFFRRPFDNEWGNNKFFFNLSIAADRFNEHRNDPKKVARNGSNICDLPIRKWGRYGLPIPSTDLFKEQDERIQR